ncbi:hypothetical protein OS493_009447 [Desmophyllum pertusum]|uniref:Uncharacterized protein n=1 Tax=Desmophyllum pertusum TaxID=174260 RepID=A0A9W9Z364_9CNID|nr:hypothetical protein OS493_009447 [Desmophyllum pertusum]
MDKRVILFVAVFFAIIAVNSLTAAMPTAEQPWTRYFDEGESLDLMKRACAGNRDTGTFAARGAILALLLFESDAKRPAGFAAEANCVPLKRLWNLKILLG